MVSRPNEPVLCDGKIGSRANIGSMQKVMV